jgi:alanyl-tRNA synthetase
MALLEAAIGSLKGNQIDGQTVFRLNDTFGFPVDLTADIARERGLTIDVAGYEAALEEQRRRGRESSTFGVDLRAELSLEDKTTFSGYENLIDTGTIVALLRGKERVEVLRAGDEGQVVLDHTPFYAESGGQVGDAGVLVDAGAEFEVVDTKKAGNAFAHIGRVKSGELRVGARIEARVDEVRRRATMANHSATHLLHAALRKVLGTHVTQKGSLVAPDRLRFDFSHFSPVTPAELRQIEELVNEEIRANVAAEIKLMSYDQAVGSGAMALFGEKYGDEVRVLSFGDFSTELCGGTHVRRAGDIGLFKIISEGGIQAGVRRIEAVTGQGAYEYVSQTDRMLRDVAALVKATRDDVEDKVRQLIERSRKLEKEIAGLKTKLASGQGNDLSSAAVEIGGMKVVATRVDGADGPALRDAVDQLKNKLSSAAIILGSVQEGDKVVLAAGVTKDQIGRVKAGDLVNFVAQQVGGRGGGRADFAQAGGNDPTKLDAALAGVAEWIESKVTAKSA